MQESETFEVLFNYANAVSETISKERNCDGYTKWIQGFHPREHYEMLDRQAMINNQNWHNNISLGVAAAAAIVAVIGIVITANYNMKASQLQADTQMQAAKMQIEAQERLMKMQIEVQKEPTVNVTVQLPSGKNVITARQPTLPVTKHDRQFRQP
jgi:hypothetical protein